MYEHLTYFCAVVALSVSGAQAGAQDVVESASVVTAQDEPGLTPPTFMIRILDAAGETEELSQITAVANALKTAYPQNADAIGAYANGIRAKLGFPINPSDEIVVVATPPTEPEPPTISADADAVDLASAPAPAFLKIKDWDGKIGATGMRSTGNSQNAGAGLILDAKREDGALTHIVKAYFDFGKSKGVKNQQRWGASYQLDMKIDDRTFGFARVAFDEDEFSGFDYRIFAGGGIGRKLFKSKEFVWKVEGGPGYQYAPIDDTRVVDSHAAVYFSSEQDWIIRPGLKLEQDFNTTWTEPTTTIISKTALTTELTDTLSTGISFFYRFETDPPAGRVKTDTRLRANINYGF